MDAYQVIKEPIISEKSTDLTNLNNQVVFKIDKRATKVQVKMAVEAIYPKVKVSRVRTMIISGKPKRLRASKGFTETWKKAVVTLAQGSKIDFH